MNGIGSLLYIITIYLTDSTDELPTLGEWHQLVAEFPKSLAFGYKL
jgi:hypothetical protein